MPSTTLGFCIGFCQMCLSLFFLKSVFNLFLDNFIQVCNVSRSYSTPAPLLLPTRCPQYFISPTSGLLLCFVLCPNPQVQLVLPACTWLWDHPLDHRQLITGYSPEKINDSLSLSSHQSLVATHIVVKPHEPLSHPLQSVDWLAFVQLAVVPVYISHVMYSR